jgi:CheY-like chemotaxis protein
MSNDLVALKVLVVSDSASERNALRDAASEASVIVHFSEVDRTEEGAACRAAADQNVDVVFLDARMSHDERQAVIDAAHRAHARPLIISLGAVDLKSADGFALDGLLAKPVEAAAARALLGACVRARLPSRVLVVDNSATVRSIMRRVLQSCRYRLEVEEAADGLSALQQADKQHFDMVLLDCNMPGLDGFATLGMFRQAHADTKVVMVTATNDIKLADKARASGAHDVLYKPFYAKDVDAVMSRLLGLRRPKSG